MGGKTIASTANDNGNLPDVTTRPLFTMRLEIASLHNMSGAAVSQVAVLRSGSFEGERLSGRVLEGGSDWQAIRPDGSLLLDSRLVLETSDGARIAMTYRGIRAGSKDVLARLADGCPVDPAEYYFRINPLFETGAPSYEWLNRVVAVGTGHRLPGGPIYRVFEIL
jgi:hypothetical protein